MRAILLSCVFAAITLAHGQDAVSLLQARNWTRNQKELVHDQAWYYSALIEALRHPDEVVRRRAAITLRLLNDKASVPALQEAFRSSKGPAKQEALWTILNLIRHTEFGMHGEPFDLEERSKAISDLGNDTVPYLVKWLRQLDHDRDYEIKLPIFAALGNLKDSRSVEELLRQTKDLWMWDLYYCFRALVQFDDPRVPAVMVRDIYKGEQGAYVDTVASWFLSKMPEKAYPHLLEGATKHRFSEGRRWCVVLLSRRREARTHPVMLKATSDKSAQVRRIAFNYFSSVRYSEAEKAIQRGLRDPDESVREEARSAAEHNGIKALLFSCQTSLACLLAKLELPTLVLLECYKLA